MSFTTAGFALLAIVSFIAFMTAWRDDTKHMFFGRGLNMLIMGVFCALGIALSIYFGTSE